MENPAGTAVANGPAEPGILTIRLQKSEQAKPRQIQISAGR